MQLKYRTNIPAWKISISILLKEIRFQHSAIWLNLTLFFVLFPYLRLIPSITAEVQPLSGLFAVLYLISNPIRKDSFLTFLPLIFVCIFYLIILVLKNSIFYLPLINGSAIESLIIFLIPILTFLVLFGHIDKVSTQLFKYSVSIWTLLATLQFFTPQLLVFLRLDSLLSALISRFSVASLAEINRGITIFSPEPSYASYVIILMFLFSWWLYRHNLITKRSTVLMLSACLWMAYLTRPASIVFSFAIIFGAYGLSILLKKPLRFFLLVPLTFVIIVTLISSSDSLRASDVFLSSLNQIFQEGLTADNLLQISSRYGSGRLPTVFVGYFSAFELYPFGNGLGAWAYSFSNAAAKMGLEIDNSKPFGYASLAAFDMGLPGLIAVTFPFATFTLSRLISGQISAFAWACWATAIFGIYANSPVSLPIYWVIFLLFYHDRSYAPRH